MVWILTLLWRLLEILPMSKSFLPWNRQVEGRGLGRLGLRIHSSSLESFSCFGKKDLGTDLCSKHIVPCEASRRSRLLLHCRDKKRREVLKTWVSVFPLVQKDIFSDKASWAQSHSPSHSHIKRPKSVSGSISSTRTLSQFDAVCFSRTRIYQRFISVNTVSLQITPKLLQTYFCAAVRVLSGNFRFLLNFGCCT